MIKESRTTAGWIFFIGFSISIFTLIIYLTEADFSDKELLLLLAILRYSSFMVCVSSVFFFITGIIGFIKKPFVFSVFQIIFSILGVFYGAGIIIVAAFFAAITNGQS